MMKIQGFEGDTIWAIAVVKRDKLVLGFSTKRRDRDEEGRGGEGERVTEEREAGVGDERVPMFGHRFEVDE